MGRHKRACNCEKCRAKKEQIKQEEQKVVDAAAGEAVEEVINNVEEAERQENFCN